MNEFFYREIIQRIYDKRATIPFDGSTNFETVKQDVSLVHELLTDTSKTVLDVGCGAGWHLEEFARLGYRFLAGIDLSRKSLGNFTWRSDFKEINLINDDFLTYEFSRKYACITNFNSCLGQFGRIKDKQFLKKVFDLLDDNGLFVMTVFTADKAENLEGSYKVKYSDNSSIFVLTNVYFDKITKKLKIDQNFSGIVIEEEMTLYKENQLLNFLREADFTEVKVLNRHSKYVSTFIGTR